MTDPIVRGLVAAHRERRLMPSGTLEGAIAETRSNIERTRWLLKAATDAANYIFAVGPSLVHIEHRAELIEDLWRQRQHLAELTAAHRQVVLEDLDERARDVSTAAYLRRFVGRLASGMVAR